MRTQIVDLGLKISDLSLETMQAWLDAIVDCLHDDEVRMHRMEERMAKLSSDTFAAVERLEAEYKALEMRMFEMGGSSTEFLDSLDDEQEGEAAGAVDPPARQLVVDAANYIDWAAGRIAMADQYLVLAPSEPLGKSITALRDTLYVALAQVGALLADVEELEKGKEE